MKRYCYSIVALLFFLYVAQACAKSNTSIGGGETNWLKACDSDADCSEGISCECGICTKSCQNSDDCTDVRGAASCLVTESLDDGTCRVAAAGESDRGICVARCETDGDCNEDSDFKCNSGICVAIIEEMPSEKGDDETRYGLIFPNSGEDGSVYDSDKEPDGSDSTIEESKAIDSYFIGPVECPCTADIEEGERALKAGDYPSNAYGGPENFMCDSGGMSFFSPHRFSNNFPYIDYDDERIGPIADLCFGFSLCFISCAADDHCPSIDSGSAVPRCEFGGSCYLDCDFQRTCPDGMTCIRGVDGAACFWTHDDVRPGCSTYCSSLLVACDPENGVDCCEGLTCAAEGYCVQQ